MKLGKGAEGSSQTIIVELDWVAVPPPGRRTVTPGVKLVLGDDDDELVLDDGDWVMLELKLPTEPIVFAVPMGWLLCDDAGRTMPA